MENTRITAISYLNSIPFIYGLKYSGLLHNYELTLEVPSISAQKLIEKKADIGLVPVGALPHIKNYDFIGNKCIGAVNNVKTVILVANKPYKELKKIYLDTDSLTSVNLVKVLAKHYWQIMPQWESLSNLNHNLADDEGMVIIGDKTFPLRNKYIQCYDLAGEWIKFTGLPFVFAVWVSVSPIAKGFLKDFEAALAWGVQHKNESLMLANNAYVNSEELISYLNNDISYNLDADKIKGMELFLAYLKNM